MNDQTTTSESELPTHEEPHLLTPDGLTLHLNFDESVRTGWASACNYAMGPGTIELCIRDFLRGLVFYEPTCSLLRNSYGLDVIAARERLVRDHTEAHRLDVRSFRPSWRLQKLLFLAGARSFEPGDGTVTLNHVIEALQDAPEFAEFVELIPKLHDERQKKEFEQERRRLDSERLEQIVNILAPMQSAIHEIQSAPGLNVEVRELSGMVHRLHLRFNELQEFSTSIKQNVGRVRQLIAENLPPKQLDVPSTSGQTDELATTSPTIDQPKPHKWSIFRFFSRP